MVGAIIDIGTNSCRLYIAETNGANNKGFKEIVNLVEITRLGEGVNKSKILNKDAIIRTIEVIKKYKKICDDHSVEKVTAYATSAVRDAVNKDDFISKVERLGIDFHVITGETEGKAAFLGATYEMNGNDKFLVIDIGGGSTEFSYGLPNTIPEVVSINIGTIRFVEMLREMTYEQLEIHIHEMLSKSKLLEKIKQLNEEYELIGVAATITGQVFISKKINYNPKISHGYRLSIKEIKGNFNELHNMSESERLLIPSMHSKRVDVIVPGTFLLYQILTFFNKNEITCSEKDLLEGHFITTYL